MKFMTFIILALAFSNICNSQVKTSDVLYNNPLYKPLPVIEYVSPYIKSDGTVVSGYFRTKKDNSFFNNYSSFDNYNIFTGKNGKKKSKSNEK